MSVRLRDGSGTNLLAVDAGGRAAVALPSLAGSAGFAALAGQRDAGLVLGSPRSRPVDVSELRRLRVGLDTPLWMEWIGAASQNYGSWVNSVATMTLALSAGWANLNSGLSTASGGYAILFSRRSFPFAPGIPLVVQAHVQVTQPPVSGNCCEWGWFLCATGAAPTDGVLFRLNSTGEFRCVVNYNGTENQSAPIDFATWFGANQTRICRLEVSDARAVFFVDDVLVAVIELPAGTPGICCSNSLPFCARTYNNATTGVAQVLKVSGAVVYTGDAEKSKPWPAVAAGAGLNALSVPTGYTSGQTAQLTNNANPTAAAPTNTTAALGSGLGGVFLANISGLAVTTDYVISSYAVPAGSATAGGRVLYVTGVRFDAVNMGAANAASPLTWMVGLAAGASAVSLATADSATGKGPRRIPLGVQSLVASAAIGVPAAPGLVVPLQTPVAVFSGEFVQTFLRFINYTSTASQALWCYVGFEGFWE